MSEKRNLFDRVETVQRTAVIVRGDGYCRVEAMEAEFTATWDGDGKTTIRQRHKSATAPLGHDRLRRFLDRLDRHFIYAALAIFNEAMAELSCAPWPEVKSQSHDDELARRRAADKRDDLDPPDYGSPRRDDFTEEGEQTRSV